MKTKITLLLMMAITATSSAKKSDSLVVTSTIVTPNTAICGDPNGKAAISVRGSKGSRPYTYAWPWGIVDSVLTGLESGIYTVTVTDVNGQTVTDAFNVPGVYLPAVKDTAYASTYSVCPGQAISISQIAHNGNPNHYVYYWRYQGDSIYGQNATIIPEFGATCYAYVIDTAYPCYGGNSYASAQFNISINWTLGDVWGSDSVCFGKTTPLRAIQMPGYSYHWSVNDATADTLMASAAGTYSVTITNSFGCTTVGSHSILAVNPNPKTPPIVYSGGTFISSGYPVYQWYLNDSIMPGETGQVCLPWGFGVYQVSVANSHGCTAMSKPYDYTAGAAGIQNYTENNEFTAYVSMGVLNFKTTSSIHIRILDMSGQVVHEGTETDMHLPLQTKGVYILSTDTHTVKLLNY